MSALLTYGPWVLTPIHVVVCLILIAVVLLQTGKGTDWAGVFGGAGTQTAFGPRGVENTLSRLTKGAAVLFMITALTLSVLQSKARREGGLTDLPSAAESRKAPAGQPAPGAEPGLAPTAPLNAPGTSLPAVEPPALPQASVPPAAVPSPSAP